MRSNRPWLTLLSELYAPPPPEELRRQDEAYGEVLVHLGLATPGQVEKCLSAAAREETRALPALSRLIAGREVMTREQLAGSLIAAAAEDPDNRVDRHILVSTLREGTWKSWELDRRQWGELTFILPEEQERLHLRARVLHPGLAAIRQIESYEGRLFVIAEHVEGVSLAAAPPAGRTRILRTIRDAALAVGTLHELGLVHGGLSLENLVVDTQGAVRVTGWGPGTRDVPAMAAALFELVADRPPPKELPPRFWPKGVSGDLRRILSRAFSDRYPSAGVFAADLSRLLDPT